MPERSGRAGLVAATARSCVIAKPGALPGASNNDTTGLRFDHPATPELHRDGGQPCLSLFQTVGQAHQEPWRLRAFERQGNRSHSFVPLGVSRCLAIVAPGDAESDFAAIEAFVVEAGQVDTFRRDMWHHLQLSVGLALVLVLVLVLERQAATVDCEIYAVAVAIKAALAG